MRRLLAIILSVGVFLGGYYLGQQPGSPDIFGWAQKNYPVVAAAIEGVAQSLSGEPGGAVEGSVDVSPRTP